MNDHDYDHDHDHDDDTIKTSGVVPVGPIKDVRDCTSRSNNKASSSMSTVYIRSYMYINLDTSFQDGG